MKAFLLFKYMKYNKQEIVLVIRITISKDRNAIYWRKACDYAIADLASVHCFVPQYANMKLSEREQFKVLLL